MRRLLLLPAFCLILVADGCATTHPSAWSPPPIPPRPTAMAHPQPPPVAPVAEIAPRTTSTVVPRVAVIPREQWAGRTKPIVSKLDPMGTPTCITVHHEGDTTVATTPTNVGLHLWAIRTSQARPVSSGGLNAGDIAYHFMIDPSGKVWEGRPLAYQGAHAGNGDANKGNIGICLLGDFNSQRPTEAQKAALKNLLLSLMSRYNIPAGRIYTHNEVKRKFGLPATDCPGKNLQVYMDGLRSDFRTASR